MSLQIELHKLKAARDRALSNFIMLALGSIFLGFGLFALLGWPGVLITTGVLCIGLALLPEVTP